MIDFTVATLNVKQVLSNGLTAGVFGMRSALHSYQLPLCEVSPELHVRAHIRSILSGPK